MYVELSFWLCKVTDDSNFLTLFLYIIKLYANTLKYSITKRINS